jgi:hypothetical protein
MNHEARQIICAVMDDPSAAAKVPPATVPVALGVLAELQAIFLAALVTGGNGRAEHEKPPPESDRLYSVAEAASMLGVTPRWLYRHAGKLPFTRRLSRKVLRFSEAGLRRYAATRRA